MGQGYDKNCDWWSVGIIIFEMLFGYPPFSSRTAIITREKIRNWPAYLRRPESPSSSDEAWDLVTKLVCDVENRLGGKELAPVTTEPEFLIARMLEVGDADNIKTHPWFQDLDWDELQVQTPPFVPQLTRDTDTSHFDAIDPETVNGLLQTNSTVENTNFEGFTYLAPNPMSNALGSK
jgi:serine/threonine protein kinase